MFEVQIPTLETTIKCPLVQSGNSCLLPGIPVVVALKVMLFHIESDIGTILSDCIVFKSNYMNTAKSSFNNGSITKRKPINNHSIAPGPYNLIMKHLSYLLTLLLSKADTQNQQLFILFSVGIVLTTWKILTQIMYV